MVPNDTSYNRWSCHGGHKLLCKLCRNLSQRGPDLLYFRQAGHADKSNSDKYTQVWISDICHKQIHGRKQISIMCNRIEHWVHIICAGIRLAQYTDTWICHLHKESRLTTHTDITPHHHSRPWSKPPTHSLPPTPPKPKHTSNNPPVPTGLVKPKHNPLIHSLFIFNQ